MIEAIYMDLVARLDYHDWVALIAILSMMATPFIIVASQNAIDKSKAIINKRLAFYGLRLKEHGKN